MLAQVQRICNALGSKIYQCDILVILSRPKAKLNLILHQASFKKVITFQKIFPLYLNIKHIYSMQVKKKKKENYMASSQINYLQMYLQTLRIYQYIPQVNSDSSIALCQIELCTVVFLS